MVMAEYRAQMGDEDHWTMADDELIELTITHLEDSGIVPAARRRTIGGTVLRSPFSYPVFLNAYEQHRLRLAEGTGIHDLLSIGRNGEFDHILMEDIYWRTRARVDAWVAQQGALKTRGSFSEGRSASEKSGSSQSLVQRRQ